MRKQLSNLETVHFSAFAFTFSNVFGYFESNFLKDLLYFKNEISKSRRNFVDYNRLYSVDNSDRKNSKNFEKKT